MKNDVVRKLTSRKFWLSVASFVSMLMVYTGADHNKVAQVASLIMAGASVIGYAIGEGLADSGGAVVEENELSPCIGFEVESEEDYDEE